MAGTPGEWYHELPEAQKPHSLPEWHSREMSPGDTTALQQELEGQNRRRGYQADRRAGYGGQPGRQGQQAARR